jgi:carbamoyl-phosphate synthase large subunit
MKAIRGLEIKQKDLRHVRIQALDDDGLRHAISKPTDERLWALAEGLRRGWGVDEVNRLSNVDKWFLRKIDCLVSVEARLLRSAETEGATEDLGHLIEEAFLLGYPSRTILDLLGASRVRVPSTPFQERVLGEVERQKVMPVFKMVDTCAGEFESQTPYYYGTFEQEDDVV